MKITKRLLLLYPIVVAMGLILPNFSHSARAKISFLKGGNEKILQKLQKSSVHVDTQVESGKDPKAGRKWQKLSYYIAGLHPKSCHIGLRKLSRYEQLEDMVDYIKSSKYNKETKILRLKIDHTVLPHPFILKFRLPRIKGPGTYSFQFANMGIFANLKGKIRVSKQENKCVYQANGFWQGKDTGLYDSLIEFFANLLSEKAMAKLFRISQY